MGRGSLELEIRRTLPGHVVFRSRLDPKLHDYQTVEYKTTVPPGKRVDLLQEVVRYQGRNAKQNNVTLEAGDVRPWAARSPINEKLRGIPAIPGGVFHALLDRADSRNYYRIVGLVVRQKSVQRR